jgi:DNA-binding CsgD family transcriptional regulator
VSYVQGNQFDLANLGLEELLTLVRAQSQKETSEIGNLATLTLSNYAIFDDQLRNLTPIHMEVLRLAAQNKKVEEIAGNLDLSSLQVRSIRRDLRVYGISTQANARRVADRLGLIELKEE